MNTTIHFTPAQARFVYLFKGFAPVATSIVTPLMVKRGLRDKPISEEKKRDIVMQEVARQVVSSTIGLAFYFGGGALTRRGLEKVLSRGGKSMGEATKQILMIVGATCAEFLGYGFVRPLISNELIVRWINGKGMDSPSAPPPPVAASPFALPAAGFERPEARLQSFMQSVETRSAGQFRGRA